MRTDGAPGREERRSRRALRARKERREGRHGSESGLGTPHPGSISDPIVQRDPLGRPVRITAQYSYAGMQGTQRGRVTVSFKDGAPDCLYFSDNPDSCRLPAAGVVSAFEKNAYAK